jgi:sRNA-binding protein
MAESEEAKKARQDAEEWQKQQEAQRKEAEKKLKEEAEEAKKKAEEDAIPKYQITLHCKNCHSPQSFRIPKKKTVEEGAHDAQCKYCECKAGWME